MGNVVVIGAGKEAEALAARLRETGDDVVIVGDTDSIPSEIIETERGMKVTSTAEIQPIVLLDPYLETGQEKRRKRRKK